MLKTIVTLPTYNEAENIRKLVEDINSLRISNLEILVVDDASPDGTAEIVQKMMKKNKKLHLLLRHSDRGRGAAGVAGFKKALEMGADVIVEMDADLSHDPRYIPFLLKGLKNADVVLGSRAVKGGKDDDRPLVRQIITKLANLYIRMLLGVKVKDCNSGYRCFKSKVLRAIDLDNISSKGPSIVQEVLYKVHLKGFKMGEVPISFVERKEGKSKLGFKHLCKGYFWVLKLRLLKILGRI